MAGCSATFKIFMNMKIKILLGLVGLLWTNIAWAQDVPTIDPSAVFIGDDGEEEEGTSYSGSAPVDVRFYANAENTIGWDAYYEWRFTYEGESEPYLIRYEEDTSYTFTKAGSTRIVLYAKFTNDTEVVEYGED